jgi:quercetin dioxygenase-like cupin family protein
MKQGLRFPVLAFCLLVFAPLSRAQEMAAHPMSRNLSDVQLTTIPGLPTCATGAVLQGDPTKGPSIILSKVSSDCTFPWHWHTPTETLIIISGTAHVQAKDGPEMTLSAGAFASMPSKHIHQFHCVTTCTLYVHSDAAFDMHYVNAEGTEISPMDALKAVKETVAK